MPPGFIKDGLAATVDVADATGANVDADVDVTGFGVVVPVGASAPQPTATVEAMKRVRGEMDAVMRRGMAGPFSTFVGTQDKD